MHWARQELWIGLSIGTTSKTGRQLQGGMELNIFASCIPSFEGLDVPTCKMGIFLEHGVNFDCMHSLTPVVAHMGASRTRTLVCWVSVQQVNR